MKKNAIKFSLKPKIFVLLVTRVFKSNNKYITQHISNKK